jgi:hypothetical protein
MPASGIKDPNIGIGTRMGIGIDMGTRIGIGIGIGISISIGMCNDSSLLLVKDQS